MAPKESAGEARPRLGTETAKRLEYVRKASGHESLQAFWNALTRDAEHAVSYDAARTYHSFREPPARYLAAVARATGARLEWLITGDGEPFELEEQVREAQERVAEIDAEKIKGFAVSMAAYADAQREKTLEALEQHAPYVSRLPRGTHEQFIETAGRLAATHRLSEDNLRVAVAVLGQLVLRPFNFLPFKPAALERGPMEPTDPAFERYVEAMLLAINLATAVEPAEPEAE